jgi:hypothetical protein
MRAERWWTGVLKTKEIELGNLVNRPRRKLATEAKKRSDGLPGSGFLRGVSETLVDSRDLKSALFEENGFFGW